MIRILLVVATLVAAAAILVNVTGAMLLGSLTSSAVAAERANDRPKLRDACLDDARRFCANVQRGNGRILGCLVNRGNELAPACRQALQETASARSGNPAR